MNEHQQRARLTVEQGARLPVRMAWLPYDGPTGTSVCADGTEEGMPLPWRRARSQQRGGAARRLPDALRSGLEFSAVFAGTDMVGRAGSSVVVEMVPQCLGTRGVAETALVMREVEQLAYEPNR
ncbi:hypothetical protein ABT186_03385 [Streptomyces sp. NPDC001634]|uniref:hypothetical protein n=1 Tax=Streptomyces sp. NPDC001634 TaxID=3154390 RepID=UPI003323045A